MAANVARRGDSPPATVSRSTRRELERIEAQQRADLERIAGSEQSALIQSRLRMRGSELLRGDAIDGIARLQARAKAQSHGDALSEQLMLGQVVDYSHDANICAITYAGRPLS
jgi:hypothetical protein